MRLERIIDETLRKAACSTKASELFLNEPTSRPRYAIGKNPETLAIHEAVPLDGIIDDHGRQGEHWHGIPLLKTQHARKDALVVNCSTSIRPVDTLEHLQRSGFKVIASVSHVIQASQSSIPLPGFVQSQRQEMESNLDAWQSIHDSLHDSTSRSTMVDVLRFRLTADPWYTRQYQVRLADQYFEDFMQYKHEVFADVGGFDGDTTEAFATRYPDYEKILFFEPSAKNMAAARTRLSLFRDIEYFQIGLSDKPKRLRFNADDGSASSVSDSGTEEILVGTLDSATNTAVSVIKMDVEGWEMPALHGAGGHIRDDRPKLAIAAYHNASDIRRIHEFIGTFGHDYQVFLRHYTQGWSETILFFKG